MRRIYRHGMATRKSSLPIWSTTAAVALGLLLTCGTTARADETWNGGSATLGPTNGFWSTTTNWVANTAPVSGDALFFNTPVAGGTRTTTNDIVGLTLNGMTFNGAQFTISGNSVTLTNTFIQNAGTTTVNLNIGLTQTTEFQINGGNSNPTVIGGVISGSAGLVKTGTRILRFAAAQTYTGDTTISNGVLSVTGNFMPNGAGKGNVTIVNGATLSLANVDATINGLFGAGTVDKATGNSRTLTVGAGDANGSFNGTLTQGGQNLNLTKTGTGTQTLGGSNNYSGVTTVNGGALVVNGLHINGNNYTVNAGGTLGGTGVIQLAAAARVTVNNGGTLSPGNSAGLLKITSGLGLTLMSNSNYRVELNGLTLGVDYDSTLVGAGLINISNSVLVVSLGFTPNVGDQFDIVTNATGNAVLGEFAGLAQGTTFTVGGTDLQITYFGGTGNDVVLTVVPEPSSLVLVGFGLLGTYWLRRRTRP